MLAIVEHELETTVSFGRQRNRLGGGQIREIRCAVTVENTFDVAVGGARVVSIALVRLGEINALGVFSFVAVDDDVTLVVIAFAYEPGKHPRRISRVCGSALRCLAIPGRDVVPGDGAPEGVLWVRQIHPALDARKQIFDAWAIAANLVLLAVYGPRWQDIAYPLAVLLNQQRHEVFRTGQDEGVGFFRIIILR